MNGGFWLGLILTIPLSIVANILTRPIQRLLDSRVRSRALRRVRDTQQEYNRVKRYREHRQEFYEFMLRSIVWIAYWTAQLVLAVGFSLLADRPDVNISDGLRQTLFTIGVIGIFVCSFMARLWWRDAIDMAYKVRHFEEYESRVKPTLESKERE